MSEELKVKSEELKEARVARWREALQESARRAVEALANETPIGKAAPSLDEVSKIFGEAIHQIRELVRPEPKTVAFWEEEARYRRHGESRTPKEAIDAIMANPPLGDLPPGADGVEPRDTPLSPDAPKMERGEDRYMSSPEAVYILGKLATSRRINVDGVIALQMGARALMKRHFDRQRDWARRRERATEDSKRTTASAEHEQEAQA